MAIKNLTKGNDTFTDDGTTNTATNGNYSAVYGLTGNDTISTSIASSIYGGAGDDSITSTLTAGTGAAHRDYLSGGNGNDVINSTGGANDVISGGNGNDTINSGNGNDLVHGDNGNDSITGGTGTQQLYGDIGNDTLTGGQGNQSLYGGVGNDVLNVGLDANTLSGGVVLTNNDIHWAYGGDGNDTIIGGTTTTTAANLYHLYGGNGNDSITGSVLGKDTILGGTGINTLTGGATGHANETVSFTDVAAGTFVNSVVANGITTSFYQGVTVDLSKTTAQNVWTLTGAATITDTISGFDNLNGSIYNDTLSASVNGGTTNAFAGNDIINGYSTAAATGVYTFNGGAGNDTINLFNGPTASYNVDGGTGSDVLDFHNVTTVTALASTVNATIAGTTYTNDAIYAPSFTSSSYAPLQGSTAPAVTGIYASLSGYIDSNSVLNFAGNGGAGSIANVEKLVGSANNDFLIAGGYNSTIDGGAGNDTLVSAGYSAGGASSAGGSGYDVLLGGTGTNIYDGTETAFTDYFGVGNAAGELDTIYGFNGLTQGDKLYVSIASFSAANSALAAGATKDYTSTVTNGVTTYGLNSTDVITNATAATSGNAAASAIHGEFLFNSTNGQLLWEAAGSAGAATLLATLDLGSFTSNHAAVSLDYSDFILVA